MNVKSYRSALSSKEYVKKYEKKSKLLNAKFMHLLLNPRDVKSIKTIVYEKKHANMLLDAECIIQLVKLINNLTLKYVTFNLHRHASFDDAQYSKDIREMLIEQMDLEDLMTEKFGFIKL